MLSTSSKHFTYVFSFTCLGDRLLVPIMSWLVCRCFWFQFCLLGWKSIEQLNNTRFAEMLLSPPQRLQQLREDLTRSSLSSKPKTPFFLLETLSCHWSLKPSVDTDESRICSSTKTLVYRWPQGGTDRSDTFLNRIRVLVLNIAEMDILAGMSIQELPASHSDCFYLHGLGFLRSAPIPDPNRGW